MPAKFGSIHSSQTHEEMVLNSIEKCSRNPFGNRQGVKPLIDVEILAGWCDPDEIQHEQQIGSPYRGNFLQADDVVDVGTGTQASANFYSDVDFVDCECEAGCIKCCTQMDFDALLVLGKQKINVRRGFLGEIFDILLPLWEE